MCTHLGEGEGPRLGHAAPPPSSVTPRALRLSLLLPAVTGVPSPRATDPPSHVRLLFFPCVKPTAPSADPIPVFRSKFRVHPTCLGFQAADSLHSSPTSTRFPQFRPLAKSRLGSPSIPCPTSAPHAISHPCQSGWAGLGSDRVTCPFSLQLDGPPAVALGQCPLVGPSPMHRRHLLLPARVRPAAHTLASATAPAPRSTHPKPLGLAVPLPCWAAAGREGARAANQHRLLGRSQ